MTNKTEQKTSPLKEFFFGFVEGYFIVALVIYVASYLILSRPVNVLFYPTTYPFILALFYVKHKFDMEKLAKDNK